MWIQLLLSTLGFGLAGALIWWVGPLIAIGEATPLVEVWVRTLLICGVGVCIYMPLVYKWVRNMRAERALNKALTETDERVQAQESKLEGIFADAIRTLTLGKSGKSLYQMPWYVFIGPPGSGKLPP